MANPHLSSFFGAEDSTLIADLTAELIYDRGVGIKYMPREQVVVDNVMHEDRLAVFNTAHDLDVLIESESGAYVAPNALYAFGGHSFGNEDSMTVFFDKQRTVMTITRMPYEGDLVYIREVDKIFEITDIDLRDAHISGGAHHYVAATLQVYKPGEGTVHFGSDVTDLETSIELLSGVMHPEEMLIHNIDFSSTSVSFDHNRDLLNIEDHEQLYTFDNALMALAGPATTMDDTSITFDSVEVTFDASDPSVSIEYSNSIDFIQSSLDPNSDNNEIECVKPDTITSTVKTPFGFW